MKFDIDYTKYKKANCINKDSKFDALIAEHKISPTEYEVIESALTRPPTMAELGVFSSMWSEHCSYKSSRVHLKRLPSEGSEVVVGPGENAGVVRLQGKLCAAFKMESHNHPSYIEPYQGSATGVGGILRDVFCMGARPIANLNCLRFGQQSHTKTGWLFREVVKGIGDYGNCVGIPTVGGNISFDKSYDGNCLVNAMTVGLIEEDKIFKGFATGIGNLVVYVGSATGRDGIHGATMASDSFDSADASERSAVQVGDPFMEKLLLEATLSVLEKDLVVGIQDMGAAGLTSSSFEMADRAGTGLWLDLDKVPTRTQGMTAYELLLSESQERMLMVIEPGKWKALSEELEKWQLAYAVIGEVTTSGRFQAVKDNVLEVDLPVAPLVEKAPKYDRPQEAPTTEAVDLDAWSREVGIFSEKATLDQVVELARNQSGSKQKIYEQYDHHIGNRTVFSSEHQGAAVMHIREGEQFGNKNLGMMISTACAEQLGSYHPKAGGAMSVLRCARSIAASGGTPLAITDCLNFGNPEDPVIMKQFSDSVDGIAEACTALDTPVVSGNVSLYNETDGVSIHPTPMIGMVGKMSDVTHAVPAVPITFPISGTAKLFVIESGLPQNLWCGSRLGAEVSKNSYLAAQTRLEHFSIDWSKEVAAIRFLQENTGSLVCATDITKGGVLSALMKWIAYSEIEVDFESSLLDALNEYQYSYCLAIHPEAVKNLKGSDQIVLREIGELRQSKEAGLNWIGKQRITKAKIRQVDNGFLPH